MLICYKFLTRNFFFTPKIYLKLKVSNTVDFFVYPMLIKLISTFSSDMYKT